MMTPDQKKQAFSWHERNLLLRLVNRYKRCIETKKADTASLAAKHRAWERVTTEYNLQPNVTPRDVKQLRKCLDNMKCKAKRCKATDSGDFLVALTRSTLLPDDGGAPEEDAADAAVPLRISHSFSLDHPVIKWEANGVGDPGNDEPDCTDGQEEQGASLCNGEPLERSEPPTCLGDPEQPSDGSVQSLPGPTTPNTGSPVLNGAHRKRKKTVRAATDLVEVELKARLDKIRAEKDAVLEYHELRMKLAREESVAKNKLLRQKFENAKLKERLLALQIGKFGFDRDDCASN